MKFLRKLTSVVTLLGLMVSVALATEPQSLAVSGAKPRVLLISPEQKVIYQTGGLAHATSDLAASLIQQGYKVEVMMPYYLEMGAKETVATGERQQVELFRVPGHSHKKAEFSVHKFQNGPVPTIFMKHETAGAEKNYFDNRTNPEIGRNYTYAPEPIEAFGVLAKAQAQYILSQNYDLVILNDWTAGLVAVHLKEARQQGHANVPKVIFAIHNIAYQGVFPKTLGTLLGLNPRYFSNHQADFYGQSYLKAGIQHSDMVYTVSQQYAKEITTPRFGAGLDGLMREKDRQNRLTGILNGIVNAQWDPSTVQEGLPFGFQLGDLSGKAKGKELLQKELGLAARADVPVFVLTSRLAEQKGFAYLADAIEEMARSTDAQWIVIGDGELPIVNKLKDIQSRYPEKVHYSKFSNVMEKKLMRYGDFFVNGAWFEPSGLNQFFALKNGTIPVVSQTGGLLDSVRDGSNGLTFPVIPSSDGKSYDVARTKQSVVFAFQRALKLFRNKSEFQKIRAQAMQEDHSWTHRIRESYTPMFDYVLKDGYLRGPLVFKSSNGPVVRSCGPLHRAGGF